MDNFGNIFSDTVDMGNKSSNSGTNRKSENSNNVDVWGGRSGSFDNNVDAVPSTLHRIYKKLFDKMASFKIAWLLFNLIGYPTALVTVLSAIFGDIMLAEIPEPFRTIVVVLGIIFMVIKIWTGYENNIEKRIKNKKSELEYQNLKHQLHHNNKH